VRWERDLLAFLRRELAPTPARWRTASRLTIACTFAVALVGALHVPDGEFVLVSLFVVSQGNSGASLEKGMQRLLATLVGGGLALATLVLSADKPWLLFPSHGIVVGVALFLSRTSTAPYAFLLLGVTFVLVLPVYPLHPEANLAVVLWRVALTALGVVIGTAAQLLLWPDDPEALLLADLGRRLDDTERLIGRILSHTEGAAPPSDDDIVATGITGQLDLLQNAEARSRWLRPRHAEQIELIADVQRLVTAARRMARRLGGEALPAWARPRLLEVVARCARTRETLRTCGVVDEAAAHPSVAPVDATDVMGLDVLAALHEMENALDRLPLAMAFLAQDPSAPPREPVAPQPLFTADCTLANGEAVRFAIKAGVAVSLSTVIIEALDAPGLSTAIISCVVVAQSFFGAGLRKGMLRIAGAVGGGMLALLVVVAVEPNMHTLASLLVVTAVCFGMAAWVQAGSSRIAYIGLQMSIVLALTLINTGGPTTNLIPIRDRLLGILLGIVVMGLVDVALWPVFGPASLRAKLGRALDQMADFVRRDALHEERTRRERALGVYRTLGDVLTMHDDLVMEPDLLDAFAFERDALLRLTSAVQQVFLSLLAVGRHRPPPGSALGGAALEQLDRSTATLLEQLGHHVTRADDAGAALAPVERTLVDRLDAVPELHELAHLYRRLLDAVDVLVDDVRALDEARRITSQAAPGIRPSRRPRTPAPQPS
jgi:multidrug resistance protein MdtO